MFTRFKLWLIDNRKDIILFIAVFLISICSFGLGYLAALQTERTPIIIEQNS